MLTLSQYGTLSVSFKAVGHSSLLEEAVEFVLSNMTEWRMAYVMGQGSGLDDVRVNSSHGVCAFHAFRVCC